MKLQLFYSLLFGAFVLLTLQSVSGGRAASGGQDRTGAPGSLGTCATCHGNPGAFSNTVINLTVTDGASNVVTSYMPGQTYTLAFTISSDGNPAGYGMQAIALDASDNNTGDMLLASTSNTQLSTITNGREFIEHQGTNPTNSFTTTWTAPASGTGDVTIHGIGMAVDGTGGTTGDNISATTPFSLTEALGSSISNISETKVSYQLFPNPSNGNVNLVNKGKAGESTIRIVDLLGQTVYDNQFFFDTNEQHYLELNDLIKGIYLVEIKKNQTTEVVQLVIGR
jgi:hypothetical protein